MSKAIAKQHVKARTEGRTERKEIGSPISNEAYNVITALQAKLEGLDAYRKYAEDSSVQIWRELAQADRRVVSRLVEELEQLVQSGKFRLREEEEEAGH